MKTYAKEQTVMVIKTGAEREIVYLKWDAKKWGYVTTKRRKDCDRFTTEEAERLARWINLCWPDSEAVTGW